MGVTAKKKKEKPIQNGRRHLGQAFERSEISEVFEVWVPSILLGWLFDFFVTFIISQS